MANAVIQNPSGTLPNSNTSQEGFYPSYSEVYGLSTEANVQLDPIAAALSNGSIASYQYAPANLIQDLQFQGTGGSAQIMTQVYPDAEALRVTGSASSLFTQNFDQTLLVQFNSAYLYRLQISVKAISDASDPTQSLQYIGVLMLDQDKNIVEASGSPVYGANGVAMFVADGEESKVVDGVKTYTAWVGGVSPTVQTAGTNRGTPNSTVPAYPTTRYLSLALLLNQFTSQPATLGTVDVLNVQVNVYDPTVVLAITQDPTKPFLNTERSMLPEGFKDIQVWADLADSMDEVLGENVGTLIRDLLGYKDVRYATNAPTVSQDRNMLLALNNYLGLYNKQNDIFSNADLQNFIKYTPQFWKEKGTKPFVNYMSFVINAVLNMDYLWTSDYVTFYPEGSPLIGAPVYAAPATIYTQATLWQFATGDGATTDFTLNVASGNISGISGTLQVYKTDWQGQQLQYQTARTNECSNSTQFGGTGWTASLSPSVTQGYGVAPDGTTTTTLLTGSAVGTGYSSAIANKTTGQILTASCWIRYVSGTGSGIQLGLGGTSNPSGGYTVTINSLDGSVVSNTNRPAGFTVTPYPGNMYRISLTGAAVANGTSTIFVYTTSASAQGIEIWGLQDEISASPTSYILTTSSSVTVTDYALSGAVVSFSSAPALDDELDWLGNFTQTPSWYPTSHVNIGYNVNAFTSTVSSNFSAQEALSNFFYSIAPIHLVIKTFQLGVTLPTPTLYYAADLQIRVWSSPQKEPMS